MAQKILFIINALLVSAIAALLVWVSCERDMRREAENARKIASEAAKTVSKNQEIFETHIAHIEKSTTTLTAETTRIEKNARDAQFALASCPEPVCRDAHRDRVFAVCQRAYDAICDPYLSATAAINAADGVRDSRSP